MQVNHQSGGSPNNGNTNVRCWWYSPSFYLFSVCYHQARYCHYDLCSLVVLLLLHMIMNYYCHYYLVIYQFYYHHDNPCHVMIINDDHDYIYITILSSQVLLSSRQHMTCNDNVWWSWLNMYITKSSSQVLLSSKQTMTCNDNELWSWLKRYINIYTYTIIICIAIIMTMAYHHHWHSSSAFDNQPSVLRLRWVVGPNTSKGEASMTRGWSWGLW